MRNSIAWWCAGCVIAVVFLCPPSVLGGDKPLVTVVGEGEVDVVPDEIVITFGVEVFNESLDKAKELNDQKVRAVLALAKKYKIDSKNVQTNYISVYPTYDDARTIDGYHVQKDILFIVKNASKFEDLLSDGLKSGANRIEGIKFRTTELEKYKTRSRALAMKAAYKEAKQLAKELGQHIGKAVDITEISPEQHMYLTDAVEGPRGLGGSTIALGHIKVSATVKVSFELK